MTDFPVVATVPQKEGGATSHATKSKVAGQVPAPFLHDGPDRLYNPLTDRTLQEGDEGYSLLRGVLAGEINPSDLNEAVADRLTAQGFLVPAQEEQSTRFHLKYVSLESHTVCNQSCYFCPVAFAPREPYFMPTELYRGILDQLTAYRETIDGIVMINYNEPTLDKRFVDQVAWIHEAGLPPSVLTNGTGLPPKRIDKLLAMGTLRYLSVNLSTLDREKYDKDRGGDHLDQVLKNLDYMKDLPVAEEMEIVVLGTGDARHHADNEEIRQRFAGSRFVIKDYEVMDRAGYLQIGSKPLAPAQQLCGCENVGSRPLQHLHITPQGKVVLCCEDYDENYIVGDLTQETVEEVLVGPQLALLRRWVYGLEEAPENFMCRKCVYALTR